MLQSFKDLFDNIDPSVVDSSRAEALNDDFQSSFRQLAPPIWFLLMQDLQEKKNKKVALNSSVNAAINIAAQYAALFLQDNDDKQRSIELFVKAFEESLRGIADDRESLNKISTIAHSLGQRQLMDSLCEKNVEVMEKLVDALNELAKR